MKKLNLKTARAYQIRLNFQELYNQLKALVETFLKKWYFWATNSTHTRWFDSGISNGILEGINSFIQAAKAKARGFRSTRNLITVVYLIAGKLDMKLPT